ncbi:hypothetical protein MMPV_008142 [Pyropia vietnamensis]
MRIVNIRLKTIRWVTVAYIPQVVPAVLSSTKGNEVRVELLQRILFLVFRSCIKASHTGSFLDLPGGGEVRVSPRALLYVCDQKEERAVMCLKSSGCQYPCTLCMCEKGAACTDKKQGLQARRRSVRATVEAQLSNASMGQFWGAAAQRQEIEMAHSLNSVPPALAAWAGLANGPELLYDLPGFDRLHLAAVTKLLYAKKCTGGGISPTEAKVLAVRAKDWVLEHYQPLLGPCHNTKLHRLAAHVMDEFRLRGNLYDGDTGLNESLHKRVKLAYKMTNRKRAQFLEQLVLVEQAAHALCDDMCDVEGDEPPPARPSDLRRLRKMGKRCTVAELIRRRDLPGLDVALGLSQGTTVLTSAGLFFGDPTTPRAGRTKKTLRAAPEFHGSPWFDWLEYRTSDGRTHIGRAEVVLHNHAGTWQRVVVKRAESAAAERGCVLSAYKCQRLRWSIPVDGMDVRLDVITAHDVLRIVVVEFDWEDLCSRHGPTKMPDALPKTAAEVRAARFFTNVFAPSV